MRLLGPEQIILEAAPETACKALRVLAPLGDVRGLHRAVLEGQVRASECKQGNRTLFVIFWHKCYTSELFVDGAAFVPTSPGAFDGPGQSPETTFGNQEIFIFAEALARHEHCEGIIFETRRAGLVRTARRKGYSPDGIILRKTLSPASHT
jgi:hypothetical protein